MWVEKIHNEKLDTYWDRPGNSGYPRLGDTGAAILQKACELIVE